jgi:hypothetical protein
MARNLCSLFAVSLLFLACGSEDKTDGGGGGNRDGSVSDGSTSNKDATPGGDAAPSGDAGPNMDATPGTDVAPGGDAGPGPMCFGQASIDLNSSGTRTGTSATTRYSGSSANAPMTPAAPDPSCAGGPVGHEVVFRYTPRATTRLRVSSNNAATTYNTLLTAFAMCTAQSPELACEDDDFEGANDNASTISVDVTQGTPLYFVLSGAGTESGPFELTVTELRVLATGQPCDILELESYCGPTASCVPDANGMDVCAAEGGQGGSCRASGMPCDAGLACNGIPGDVGSTCVPEVPLNGMCDPSGIDNICAAPNVCVDNAGNGTCRAPFYTETRFMNPMLIDACGLGTRAALTDDDDGHTTAAITIPFSFNFFGTAQTQVWASTNGYATFGATEPSDLYSPFIPEPGEGPSIFAFWQDLTVNAMPSGICTHVVGNAPNRTFVIEWQDMAALDATDPTHLTFELLLHETTNVFEIIYSRLEAMNAADMDYVNGTTAGFGAQTDQGTNYVIHRGGVMTSEALRFTP